MASCREGEDYEYETEAAAVAALSLALSDHFDLFKEVHVAIVGHNSAHKIDLLARHREKGWVIGFEVKQGHFNSSDYVAAFKQAIDYQMAVVDDTSVPDYVHGRQLAAVFVFPDWALGAAKRKRTQFDRECRGVELLAAKFKVGSASLDVQGRAGLTMAQGRLGSPALGWGSDAENVLFGKVQVASARRNRANLARQ